MKRKEMEEKSIEEEEEKKEVIQEEGGDEEEKEEEEEYTKESLDRLYRVEVMDIANKLGFNFSKETKKFMIKKILSHKKETKKVKDHQDQSTIKDFNIGSLEYVFPWPIMQKIFTIAFKDDPICTCVNRHQIADLYQKIANHEKEMKDAKKDIELQRVLFTNLYYKPQVKEYELKKEEMCTFHQNIFNEGSTRPSYVFVKDDFRCFEREGNRWRRSLSLVSKRLFNFFSTLITDVVVEPTVDSWSHFKNEHCIIKKPIRVTIAQPASGGSIPRANAFIKDFFQRIEEAHINGKFLFDKIDNLRQFVVYGPNIRKISSSSTVNKSMLKELLTGFKQLTSVNLVNASLVDRSAGYCDLVSVLSKCLPEHTSIRKLFLPYSFRWSILHPNVKKNLVALSIYEKIPDKFEVDFPNLRHLYIKSPFLIANIPSTIKKISFGTIPDSLSTLHHLTNLQYIKIIAFNERRLEESLSLNFDQTFATKVVFVSPVDILDSYVERMTIKGFQYLGSTLSIPTNRKKMLFTRMSPQQKQLQIQQLQLKQKQKKDSEEKEVTTPITSPKPTTKVNERPNPTLPNHIILNIIDRVWKLREYCMCAHDQDMVQRWINEGYAILEDDNVVEEYFKVRNNCPVHFGVMGYFTPLVTTLAICNVAKHQLTLINKEISKHLHGQFKLGLSNDHYIYTLSKRKEYNQYSTLQVKRLYQIPPATITNPEYKYLMNTVTKASFIASQINQQITDALPNITSVTVEMSTREYREYGNDYYSKVYYKHIPSPFQISPLQHWSHLTKLKLNGSFKCKGLVTPEIIDGLKQMPHLTKLYFPVSDIDLYPTIPSNLKKNLTSVSFSLRHTASVILKGFTNLNHLNILFAEKTKATKSIAELPVTVQRITTQRGGELYVASNNQLHTVKLITYTMVDIDYIIRVFKRLSKSNHLTTLILENSSIPTFHIPYSVERNYGFKAVASRGCNSGQYLIFKRTSNITNDNDEEDDDDEDIDEDEFDGN